MTEKKTGNTVATKTPVVRASESWSIGVIFGAKVHVQKLRPERKVPKKGTGDKPK